MYVCVCMCVVCPQGLYLGQNEIPQIQFFSAPDPTHYREHIFTDYWLPINNIHYYH